MTEETVPQGSLGDGVVRYARRTEIVSAMLGAEEAALLSASRGKYYGLNSTASRIWELLESPRSIDELIEALQAEYEVGAEECRQHTSELVAELVAENLVGEVK
jgi:hypothetical protein